MGTGVRNSSHISARKETTNARRNSLMTNIGYSNRESDTRIERKKTKMSGSGAHTPKIIEFC
jgi:hypothetical protein